MATAAPDRPGTEGHDETLPARSQVADRVMRAAIAESMFGAAHVPPARAGRFELLRSLGSGGMGTVYLARDPQLGRKVALKVLRPDLHDASVAARLQREAIALARLSHPNVVGVHEVGNVDGEPFVAMEYVPGGDLAKWLHDHPEASRPRTAQGLSILLEAGRGLAAAHGAGLVHRDFKPSNVLLGDDGRARVADFGLAHAQGLGDDPHDAATTGDGCDATDAPTRSLGAAEGGPTQSQPATNQDRLTLTGTIMGTPRFMSPEQQRGGVVGAASDQFSFCVTAWLVLYGATPWPAFPVASEPPSPPPGAPSWQVAVLLRGLAEDPADRYPDMNALLAALAHDPTRRRRAMVGSGVVLVAATSGLAGFSPPPRHDV